MKQLRVIEVSQDIIVCLDENEQTSRIDIEGLVIQFKVGDTISSQEHGYCDIHRNSEVVGGLTNLFTRLIQ